MYDSFRCPKTTARSAGLASGIFELADEAGSALTYRCVLIPP
jgi:hypothetical protein